MNTEAGVVKVRFLPSCSCVGDSGDGGSLRIGLDDSVKSTSVSVLLKNVLLRREENISLSVSIVFSGYLLFWIERNYSSCAHFCLDLSKYWQTNYNYPSVVLVFCNYTW